MGSGASVADVAEHIVTTCGNDYLQYRPRIEEEGIDGNKLAKITQQEIPKIFDRLGITNPKHRESLLVSLVVRNIDIPTHVTTTPRKLMGDLFAIQGISLDPSDIEAVVTKITHAIGSGGGDGVNSFDVFISYRVATDADLAEKLYIYLKTRGIHAFLDKRCLKDGEKWKVGFFKGLLRSRKFLCLVSSDALASVRDTTKNHIYDNVLLEYETAFMIKKLLEDVNVDMANSYIIPVFVAKLLGGGMLEKFSDFDLTKYPNSVTAIAEDSSAGPEDNVMFLLIDEFIAAYAEEALAEMLMYRALEVQEMPWNRSKMMFVGTGRAGKTGTMRSMLGHNDHGPDAFVETASTVGIDSDWSCDVVQETAVVDGDATFESDDVNRWISTSTSTQDKRRKNYESALAGVIAAIKQGKLQEALQVATQAAQTAMNNTTEAAVAREQAPPSKRYQEEANGSGGVGEENGASIMSSAHDDGPLADAAVVRGIDTNSNDDSALLLSELETKPKEDLDSEFFMRTMIDRLKINEKLTIALVDFGGQRVFGAVHGLFMNKYGLYLLCFNMVSWLADQQQCEKDIKMWVNSVVVYTGTTVAAKATGIASTGVGVENVTVDRDLQPAPILIVGTHKDQVADVADHRRMSKSIEALFGDTHPVWKNLHENDSQKLVFFPVDNTQGRHDPVMQDLMKQTEAIIENEDYVTAKKPLVYMQVLDLILAASRSCLLYSEVVSFAKDCGMDVRSSSPGIVPKVDEMLQSLAEIGAVLWFPEEGLRSLVIRDAVKGFVGPITKVICQHVGTDKDATQHFLSVHKKMKKKFRAEFNEMVAKGVITHRLLEGLMSDDIGVHADQTPVVIQLMIKFGLLVPLLKAEGDAEGVEFRKYLVPALLPDDEPVPVSSDTFAAPLSGGVGPGEGVGGGDSGHRFLFYFSTVAADHFALRTSNMKNEGFLPDGLVVRLIGKVLMRSQHTTRSNTSTCHQRWIRVYFGTQQFLLTHLVEYNAIQVDIIGRGTPMAIHARLLDMITKLMSETCQSLHVVTLVGHGDAPVQGLLRASSPSGLRPMFVTLPAILNAIQKSTPVLGPCEFILGVAEVAQCFPAWLVQPSGSKGPYDIFISYRWGDHDSQFTAMLADHCQFYTIGEENRSLRIFLDNRSLEMGLDFQRSFVGALVQSTVVTMVVSNAALLRMTTHDPLVVDNLLLEWLCAKYCLERGIIRRILPVFFGRQSPLDSAHLGLDFFEAYVDVGVFTPPNANDDGQATIEQRLSDRVTADATVAKAIELLTYVGCWQVPTSTSTPPPAAAFNGESSSSSVNSHLLPVFGLPSFSVRAIVKSIVACNGIFAKKHNTMYDLLCTCGNTITSIVTDTLASSSPTHISASPSSPSSFGALAGLSLGGSGGGGELFGAADGNVGGGGGGGMSPVAVLVVSGAKADQQARCEGAMCEWLLAHTASIHADITLAYAQAFYAAKMITIDRVAKKVGKEPGFLLSLGVDEDDADDIVQAMRDARMLTAS